MSQKSDWQVIGTTIYRTETKGGVEENCDSFMLTRMDNNAYPTSEASRTLLERLRQFLQEGCVLASTERTLEENPKLDQLATKLDFEALRQNWTLKAPMPDKDRINFERQKDRQANPHNENYHNKKPLRDENEIIADFCTKFADDVLTRVYGRHYTNWLKDSGYEERWWPGYWQIRS